MKGTENVTCFAMFQLHGATAERNEQRDKTTIKVFTRGRTDHFSLISVAIGRQQ